MNNKDFEPIRIRIMQEAYELADRGDAEGYNSVKVMCNDVQNLLRREWVGLNGADWNDFNPLLSNDPHRVADWVEKILKERNT